MKVVLMPLMAILTVFIIAVLLQSCGVVEVDHIKSPPLMQQFVKVDVALWILGTTIVVGTLFGYYLYKKITVLEDRIKQINHSG